MTKPKTSHRRTTASVSHGTRHAGALHAAAEKAWLDDAAFNGWIASISRNLKTWASLNAPLFISTPVDLFSVYLRNIPKAQRQYHNCNTCKSFINKYGRLLIVGLAGDLKSAIWSEEDAPAFYQPAVKAMIEAVLDAGIASPFVCREVQWGAPGDNEWTHFATTPPKRYISPQNPIKNEHQLMAEKVEDYKNVDRALREFSVKTLDLAVALLEGDALYRAEKVLAPAKWLQGLAHERATHRRSFTNRLWAEVAIAPAGFCHPRASMIGSLLEDLENKSLDDARRAFAAKMNPLAYMRPQAAPSEQTIDRAEKLVEQLGIKSALMRRLANPGDIPEGVKIWTPKNTTRKTGGVFDILRCKDEDIAAKIESGRMTWAKFERDILPTANEIAVRVPTMGNFTILCTAVDSQAKPIMRWDEEGPVRNPFNWYVWHGGSPADQHYLSRGWTKVYAITDRACNWLHPHAGFPPSRWFFLEGAGERRTAGSALFPECIRTDLHEVRSVIERYSKTFNLPTSQHAAVALPIADNLTLEVRVKSKDLIRTFTLDRME